MPCGVGDLDCQPVCRLLGLDGLGVSEREQALRGVGSLGVEYLRDCVHTAPEVKLIREVYLRVVLVLLGNPEESVDGKTLGEGRHVRCVD